MVEKWIADLKEKTGRSLDEWLAFARKEGPKDEKSQREWLKINQKLGTNAAWWIAARVAGKESEEALTAQEGRRVIAFYDLFQRSNAERRALAG